MRRQICTYVHAWARGKVSAWARGRVCGAGVAAGVGVGVGQWVGLCGAHTRLPSLCVSWRMVRGLLHALAQRHVRRGPPRLGEYLVTQPATL